MKKEIIVFKIIVTILLSSCSQDSIMYKGNNTKSALENPIELSLEEYISIAYDKPEEIGEDKVRSIINKFIDNQKQDKTKQNSFTIKISNKYFIEHEETKMSERVPIVRADILNGEERGTIFISADERFPDILAYIPEVTDTLFDNNSGPGLLLKSAENVLLSKSKSYNQLKDSLRIPTLEKIAKRLLVPTNEVYFDDIKNLIEIKKDGMNLTRSTINKDPLSSQELLLRAGPFVFNEWDQLAPYNNSLGGSCTDWFGDLTNYNVSAVIVATSQIMAFFEPSLNISGTQINWSYLNEKAEIVEPDYFNPGDPIEKRNMVASLMKYCSDQCSITYTCDGSSYYMNNIIDFLKKYGINADSSRSFDFNMIKSALDNMRLTLCHGKTSTNGGHSWLIDGYMVISPTGSILNTNTYVHANMGMGSYYNGYYLVNSNTELTFDTGFAHFNNNIIMYTNIRK